MGYKINAYSQEDIEGIRSIYNHFITETAVSFETMPLTAGEMRERLSQIDAEGHVCFVCKDAGQRVVGFVWLHSWNWREAFKYTAELTIYVAPGFDGHGIGTALMEKIIDHARTHNLHTLVSCITMPNDASVRLHEKFGFERVAYFKEVGYKNASWHDVCHMQLML